MPIHYCNFRASFSLCVIFVFLLTGKLFVDNSYLSFNNIMQMIHCDSQNVDLMFLELMRRNVSLNSPQVDVVIQKYLTSRNYSVDPSEIVTDINKTMSEGESLNVWNLTALVSRIGDARRRSNVTCKMQNYVSTNFTIVTAYWNLGTFQKGKSLKYSKKLYMKWAASFKYMLNPLVVYTDSTEFRDLMQTHRNDLLCNTKIIFMNRTDIDIFRKIHQIQSVYMQPGYPKYYPNTVNPGYTAAQHAKFTVVAETYRRQLFTTRYYAWMDVGYFRDIANAEEYYVMVVPPDMDPKRLAYNFAKHHVRTVDPITVFRKNLVWVGGGMFIGLGEVIDRFEKFYQKAVDYFMNSRVMNSDQQVLYSIYTYKGRKVLKPPVELQLYIPKPPHNSWFYLGFLCRKVVKDLPPVKLKTFCITTTRN